MKTIVLGDEYDVVLRESLQHVLQLKGAAKIDGERGFAGSQEVEVLTYSLGDSRIVVESETYVGLSVTGPDSLVDAIASDVRSAIDRNAAP